MLLHNIYFARLLRSIQSPAHKRGIGCGRLMRVTGHSMTPSLKPGELVVVDQRAYAGRDPRRDEVVAARPQACGGRALVKRIAGLPNEEVQVAGTRWRLGPDEFFLLGEQAGDSADSRQFGPVRRHELLGPVHPLRPFVRQPVPT